MINNTLTSNSDIDLLISCPKIFQAPPKKPVTVNRNSSQTFDVFSQDCQLKFSVFISLSLRMPQDFSLGLMYDGFLLIRCNGFHGTTRAGFYTAEHHAHPHAHVLTMEDIENGRSKKPSRVKDLTGEYINLDTAKVFFFKRCGILDYDKYFDINQFSLF